MVRSSKIILLLILFSCATEEKDTNFYTKDSKYQDVWRFPIVNPYEMVTAVCCSDWHIGIFSKLGNDFSIETDVDSLGYNYKENKIAIYENNQNKAGETENRYIVLSLNDTTKMEYFNYENFILLNGNVNLYEIEKAYNFYKKNSRPPWQLP